MAMQITDEEKLLIRRAYDKRELCEKRYQSVSTGFLNEREQDILLSEFESKSETKAIFTGGYENAERRMLVFVPEYLELDEEEHIAAIRCTYYKDYELTHRDFLGALMGLGIERETVGDIVVDKKNCRADIIIKADILPFLLSDFVSAGRARLKVEQIPLSELESIEIETVELTDTVSSPRLDAIIACGFGLSRENASALVKSGKVYLNRRSVSDSDKAVTDGSLINATGYGKFKCFISGNVSKKGRIFIKIQKYI